MDLREIDRLVAEKVMGWDIEIEPDKKWNKDYDYECWYAVDDPPDDCPEELKHVTSQLISERLPDFSTNIADAWQVVEKLREEVAFLDILPAADHYIVKIQSAHGTDYVTAETAPLAICLAALKVKGVDG